MRAADDLFPTDVNHHMDRDLFCLTVYSDASGGNGVGESASLILPSAYGMAFAIGLKPQSSPAALTLLFV
jgi:hypothetical protein